VEKSYRLKKNHDIARVIQKKVSVGSRFYVIYFVPNDHNTNKIAISVSKRYGCAVKRNYAKRVVREIVRLQFKEIKNLSLVIIIKDASQDLDFSGKKRELEQLIRRMKKRSEEK
jgi:ribonuclease P protein component